MHTLNSLFNFRIPSEKAAPCMPGHYPIWIDIGENHNLIPEAIKTIRTKYTYKFDRSQQFMLYANRLDERVKKMLVSNWNDEDTCMLWSEFIGNDRHRVMY